MTRTILLALFFSLLYSCSGGAESSGGTSNNSRPIVLKTREAPSNYKESICACYDGIGALKNDTPLMTFDFLNGRSVSVCGYKDSDSNNVELRISEFNIFDCISGESYVEFGALDDCIVSTHQDTLLIELFVYLPYGDNWRWESVKVGEQLITAEASDIEVSEIQAKYKRAAISSKRQIDFLSSLKGGNGFGDNWEEELARLEVLSLFGNEKAWKILKNYEEYVGETTDGALAEQWKDAVATVEWIRGNEK